MPGQSRNRWVHAFASEPVSRLHPGLALPAQARLHLVLELKIEAARWAQKHRAP